MTRGTAGSPTAPSRGRARRAAGRDDATRAAAAPLAPLDRFAAGRGGLVLVLLVALAANLAAFDPRLNTNGDNAQFLVLGESILQGKGLTHANSPGEEPHTKYPFLYPLLLAGVLAIFPGELLPAKGLSLVLGVASCGLVLVLLRRRLRPSLALGASLAAAVSPHILEFSHITLSEVPYLFFSLLALVLLDRIAEAKQGEAASPLLRALPLLALGAIMAAYYVKSVGLALALAAPLAFALRRRYGMALVFLAGFAVLSFPWYLRNKAVGQANLYLDYFLMKDPYVEDSGRIDFAGFLARVGKNVGVYERRVIPNAIAPTSFAGGEGGSAIEGILFVIPLVLVAAGIVASLAAGRLAAEIYTLSFLAMIHAWPEVWSSVRFLLPLVPLLAGYALLGTERLVARVSSPRTGGSAALAAAVLLVLLGGAATARELGERREYTPDWVNFFAAADWIRDHTPPEAIVSSRSSYVLYWKTHRKTTGYRFSQDAEGVFRDLIASGARYVLVDSFFWTGTTGRYLVPALEAHKDRWRVVWNTDNPPTYVLEIVPESGGGS